MPDELYLIAHKVRGEPAFDIAIPLQIGDEEGWIIPTSGHRAYPIMTWRLDSCVGNYAPHCDWQPDILTEAGPLASHPDFDAVEDHYPISRAPSEPRTSASGLLAALGLGAPKVKIERRL